MSWVDVTEGPLAWFCAELAQLRADAGGPTLRQLSSIRGLPGISQLSEIFSGKIKKVPDRDIVQALVAACLAYGRDRPLRGPRDLHHWLARYDDLTLKLEIRSSTRSNTALPATHIAPVNDWNPFALGVHRPITAVGTEPESSTTLTPYVPRRHDGQLRRLLDERQSALMAVLVGESSTGKTRSMFEAVRACLPDWPLAQPHDAEALLTLVETLRFPIVLWLNETQRYLDGPAGPFAAQALHRLLSLPPGPVVVLGSMWLRQHWERFTREPGTGDLDVHQYARELLRGLAHRIDVPPTFDDSVGRRALAVQSMRDRRLAMARDTANAGRVIQVLAGGVELANQYNHPTDPYGHAVLTAAIDARRLGFQALLPEEFLRQAAPGYLAGRERSSPAAQSGEWFADALAYTQRPLHGIAALTPDRRQEGMGAPDGFQLHDYLDQHGRAQRRAEHVPETTWNGLVAHAKEMGDVVRIVEQAADRALYRYAYELYSRAKSQGFDQPMKFQRYLARIGILPDEKKMAFEQERWFQRMIIPVHRARDVCDMDHLVSSKQPVNLPRLVQWLTREGRQNDIESALRWAVLRNVPKAHERLVEWLVQVGKPADVERAWREAFAEGRAHAWERLVDWLNTTGRPEEAEGVLRQAIAVGAHAALYLLINLLHTTGRDAEIEQVLREATDAGHVQAPGKLADLLCAADRYAEAEHSLRHAILIGHSSAISRLAVLLSRTDRQAEADQFWRFGLTVEGDTSSAW